MKIGFDNARTQRLFNDHAELEARYGHDLASRIASRMALLSVARDLTSLPHRAPIHFRCDDEAQGLFGVDAGPAHRLQFLARDAKSQEDEAMGRGPIEEVIVAGIVDI